MSTEQVEVFLSLLLPISTMALETYSSIRVQADDSANAVTPESPMLDLFNQGANCTNDYFIMMINLTTPVVKCYPYSMISMIFIGAILGLMTIGTGIGNILVIMAVGLVKKLQTPSNLLIVSLACSDFLVSIMVFPLAMVTTLKGHWIFGETVCDIYIAFDVFLCTSSILNLCAISIDRYLVITKPLTYAVNRTPLRMGGMIAIVWIVSALISVPAIIIWKDEFVEGTCTYSSDIGYQIYATFGAFYIPLIVMLVLYGRIFRLAAHMASADAKQKLNRNHSIDTTDHLSVEISGNLNTATPTNGDRLIRFKDNHGQLSSAEGNGPLNPSYSPLPNGKDKKKNSDQSSAGSMGVSSGTSGARLSVSINNRITTKIKNGLSFAAGSKKPKKIRNNLETKAIKTLGVIMGCFTVCWLPFFIIQIAIPFITLFNRNPMEIFSEWVIHFFLWLGYLNSFLNPVIYAKFNREFRTPFKEIMLCHCESINARLRSESYAEQYGLPMNNVRRESYATHSRRRSSEVFVHVSKRGGRGVVKDATVVCGGQDNTSGLLTAPPPPGSIGVELETTFNGSPVFTIRKESAHINNYKYFGTLV